MFLILAVIFLNNLIFIALWQMSVYGNLDRLEKKQTRGILKMAPEMGVRYAEYFLAICIFLLDFLLFYVIFS